MDLAPRRRHADRDIPIEVRSLGRTLARWRDQIVAWHRSHVSNGPTEAANNLIMRVKRAAFGFSSFRNFRVRALLYAGKPDWSLLETITPVWGGRRHRFERNRTFAAATRSLKASTPASSSLKTSMGQSSAGQCHRRRR